jgi:hypothetical protein
VANKRIDTDEIDADPALHAMQVAHSLFHDLGSQLRGTVWRATSKRS